MTECSKHTFSYLGRGSAHVVLGDNTDGDAIRIFLNAHGTKNDVEFVNRHVEALGIFYGKYLPQMTCCPVSIEARNTLNIIDGIEHQDDINNEEIEWGLKVCNMMKIWLPLPLPIYSTLENIVVTVELKPKSAALFAARSLLVGVEHVDGSKECSVHYDHDVKFRQSRFSMNQFHKKTTHGHSTFSPSLLFQSNGSVALRQLLDAPQNNFKVFVNGIALVLDVDVSERTVRDEMLSNHLIKAFGRSLTGNQPIDWFLTQIERVLEVESEILESLVLMQERDVLDIEGANIVLHKLTQTRSLEATLELINQALCGEGGKLVDPPSPEVVKALAWQGHGDGPEPPSEEVRRGAFDFIASLDDEICIQLLANWLLSLAACDVSIMTSFTTVHTETGGDRPNLPQQVSSAGIIQQTSTEQTSNTEEASTMEEASTESIGTTAIAYCIGLTDVGPKDSAKIMSKIVKEGKFCREALIGLT